MDYSGIATDSAFDQVKDFNLDRSSVSYFVRLMFYSVIFCGSGSIHHLNCGLLARNL